MTSAPPEPKRPNVPLLRQTLAHIEDHPAKWDQSTWANDCGTAYCFAGHAVRLHGGRIVENSEEDVYVIPPAGEDLTGYAVEWVQEIGGERTAYIQEYASELLGLTFRQGMRLFAGINTLPDLRRIVGELCADAEAVPSE